MSSLTLQLDNDALREATAQALIGVLTPEVKAKIMQDAIQAVLKPSTDSWNRGKSPLDMAFEGAVRDLAHQEAKRLVAEDPVLSVKIKELMRATADKVLNSDQDKLAERMADAFCSSMRRD